MRRRSRHLSATLTISALSMTPAQAAPLPDTLQGIQSEALLSRLRLENTNMTRIGTTGETIYGATLSSSTLQIKLRGPHAGYITQATISSRDRNLALSAAALLSGRSELTQAARMFTIPKAALRNPRNIVTFARADQVYTVTVAAQVHPDSHFSADEPVLHPGRAGGGQIRILTDHGCPYCQALITTFLPAWIKQHGQAKITAHAAPNESLHPGARRAALYAWCAYRTDRTAFKLYDLTLYTDTSWSSKTPDVRLRALAAKTSPSLASKALVACVVSNTAKKAIEFMVNQSAALHINGTPTVFVNGVAMLRWDDMEELHHLLRLRR